MTALTRESFYHTFLAFFLPPDHTRAWLRVWILQSELKLGTKWPHFAVLLEWEALIMLSFHYHTNHNFYKHERLINLIFWTSVMTLSTKTTIPKFASSYDENRKSMKCDAMPPLSRDRITQAWLQLGWSMNVLGIQMLKWSGYSRTLGVRKEGLREKFVVKVWGWCHLLSIWLASSTRVDLWVSFEFLQFEGEFFIRAKQQVGNSSLSYYCYESVSLLHLIKE